MEKLYEEKWYQRGQKRSNSGQKSEVVPLPKQGGTGTTQQKPIGTGSDTSSTGTAHQNQIGTGTDQSGTDTVVPKMPRLFYFCIFKAKFTHRLYRNLTK